MKKTLENDSQGRLMMIHLICIVMIWIYWFFYNDAIIKAVIVSGLSGIIFLLLVDAKKRNLTIYLFFISVAKWILAFYSYCTIYYILKSIIDSMVILNDSNALEDWIFMGIFYILYIGILFLCNVIFMYYKTFHRLVSKKDLFSFHSSYISHVCIYVFFPIIFIVFIYFYQVIPMQMTTLICFIAMIIVTFFYQYGQAKIKNISISCINLENKDIKRKDVYLLSTTSKNYQIFKFDFENLFPENSTDCAIYITNKFYSRHANKFNNANDNSRINDTNEKNNRTTENDKDRKEKKEIKYIYLSIDKVRQNEKLAIYYSYKQNGKEYRIKCDLYLEIRCYSSLVYISQYQFKNFRRVVREFEINTLSILEIFTKIKRGYAIDDYPLEYHALSAIKYCDTDGKLISIRAKEDSIHEYRKWLFHNGEFGMGKTTYDIYYAMEQGYQPVIVSPWEAHFDKDILQLIYLNMSNNHKEGLFAGISRKVFVFLAINMGALFLFFDNNIVKEICKIFYNRFIHTFYTFVSGYMENISFDWSASEIGYIIFMFASIFLSIYFLPSILLLKNGDTEKYQGFYIERIRSMYNNNPNIFLIIEDVDRLDPKVQEEVFRILSLLNSHIHQLKALGVISVDKTYIKIDKDGDPDKMLETIQNKIIYETIGEGYDYEKSIDLYLEEGVEFLYQYNHDLNYDCDLSLEDLKNEIQRKSDDNFRDVHKEMEFLIKNINSGKYKKN